MLPGCISKAGTSGEGGGSHGHPPAPGGIVDAPKLTHSPPSHNHLLCARGRSSLKNQRDALSHSDWRCQSYSGSPRLFAGGPMRVIAAVAGLALIVVIFTDCFQAMILPRRVTWRWRPGRLFYRSAWRCGGARPPPAGRASGATVSEPLRPPVAAVLFSLWAVGLIAGFALLHWSLARRCTRRPASRPTASTLPLPQRRDVLHAGLRRRHRRLAGRPAAGGGRGRAWASASWPSSSATCRCSTRRSRAARSSSRCWTPAPARRRAPPSCCCGWAGRRPASPRPSPSGRVGALGGRAAGEPPVVPRAELLPLAARQPVVAGGADGRARCLRPAADRGGGRRPPTRRS